MSITNYKIKGYDGNYYDISGVFSNKTSAATVASSNPYKYSTTTNILNNFEVYSNDGTMYNPLQTNVTGYKINGKDIAKYYTPYYGVKDGSQTPSSFPIPSWVSKVTFVIQAAGGNNGSNSTGSPQIAVNIAYHRYTRSAGYHYYTPSPSVNQYFVSTKQVYSDGMGYGNQGKLYYKASSTSYTGGNGSGGTCYAGSYTIDNTNRTTAMTYTNNGSTSYLQFNDSLNSKVTVPNGTTGTNATSSGAGAFGGSSSEATFVNSSYFSGDFFITSTINSGYSTIHPIINSFYPIPPGYSFTGRGGSTQAAYFIYWFSI